MVRMGNFTLCIFYHIFLKAAFVTYPVLCYTFGSVYRVFNSVPLMGLLLINTILFQLLEL